MEYLAETFNENATLLFCIFERIPLCKIIEDDLGGGVYFSVNDDD